MLLTFINKIYNLIKSSLFDNKIIIINSQLQFINFIEYQNLNLKNKIEYKKNNIFITTAKKNEVEKIFLTKIKFKNNHIFDINFRYFKLLLFLILKLRSLLNNELDFIIIGDHNNITKKYNVFFDRIRNFTKKIVTLDDGTNIFYLKKIYNHHNYIFFSHFDKKYFDTRQNRYIKNEYTHIKALKKKTTTKKNYIILLGTPFLKKSLIKEKHYIKCLKFLKKKYINRDIYYFPHPKENTNDIRKLNLFKIIKSNVGFEIYLLSQKIIPSKIIGFNSTALIIINILFNKRIDLENYFYINENNKYIGKKNLLFQKKIINYFSKYLNINTKFIKL